MELLRRQKDDTENDIEKYKTEIRRLDEDLRALLADLDQETLRRVKLENEKQTLEEQIPFLNAIHEQEMAELRLLQSGAQLDPTQFYRHELERAIRDIRGDFEELNEQQKRELEEWSVHLSLYLDLDLDLDLSKYFGSKNEIKLISIKVLYNIVKLIIG